MKRITLSKTTAEAHWLHAIFINKLKLEIHGVKKDADGMVTIFFPDTVTLDASTIERLKRLCEDPPRQVQYTYMIEPNLIDVIERDVTPGKRPVRAVFDPQTNTLSVDYDVELTDAEEKALTTFAKAIPRRLIKRVF